MNNNINVTGFKELIESQEILFGEVGKSRINEENNSRNRNDYQKDYARILYSSSFRRLQGKMQLMAVNPDSFERNRLTHSLEVAQIARSIAENVYLRSEAYLENNNKISIYGKNKDIYVVELGGLAHDIGNPPFGHHGERMLNKLMIENGGFEGNAQSIRNLMHIEKKHPHFAGLNLTIRSLLSVIKYYVPYEKDVDKFLYKSQFEYIDNYLKELNLDKSTRTLDVQIVDAADEIAYCAHDLEDALSKKYFSIDEFIYDLKQDAIGNEYPYKTQVDKFINWVAQAKKVAEESEVYQSSEEYSFIFRKELTSIIVNELINDIDIIPVIDLKENFKEKTGTFRENELGFKCWKLVRGIKQCTFAGVNRSNEIQIYEKLGTKVINGLFEALTDNSFNKDLMLLPVEYRFKKDEEFSEDERDRKVVDYISGMMDTYAIKKYQQFYSDSEAENLYKEVKSKKN